MNLQGFGTACGLVIDARPHTFAREQYRPYRVVLLRKFLREENAPMANENRASQQGGQQNPGQQKPGQQQGGQQGGQQKPGQQQGGGGGQPQR